MRHSQRALIAGFIVPLIVLLDQWTKSLILKEPVFNALNCLDRTERCGQMEVSSIFDFSMVWNYGISYGLLQSDGFWRWVLVAVTASITVMFAVWLFRATHWLTVTALAIIVAGAFGNLIDRVLFGAVVDFIDVSELLPFFPWVFNIADSAVTVGAILLLLDQIILSRQEED